MRSIYLEPGKVHAVLEPLHNLPFFARIVNSEAMCVTLCLPLSRRRFFSIRNLRLSGQMRQLNCTRDGQRETFRRRETFSHLNRGDQSGVLSEHGDKAASGVVFHHRDINWEIESPAEASSVAQTQSHKTYDIPSSLSALMNTTMKVKRLVFGELSVRSTSDGD